ncbi:MAG TPA: uroporphyrinogen decarboxylase family protein [Syntrophorhabdales bacterium]|nr:uroporphyrinogen decarboxylase family protein [Syntrophorhabdales bacterium]
MKEMRPRERVLSALRRETPDRVPWVENDIEEGLQERIMGTTQFAPGELCEKLGMDGFGYHFPMGGQAVAGQALQAGGSFKETYYYPQKVTFDFVPPWIAEMGVIPETGRTFVKKGLLTSNDSLKLFDEYLPDPDHPARYEQVSKWIDQYKGDYAVFARIRLGSASMLESMGIVEFAYNIYDNPDLIKEVHRRFSEWSAKVVEHLNKMDFHFYWVNDDHADTRSTWMSREQYQEFFLPYQKIVADAIRKPWVFHSDGNLLPILDDLLTLGMAGIHPIQPSAMDIKKIKANYGNRVCILGNIDLDYTLTLGSPEEVDKEVKERIATTGVNGGYIVTSANSLTDYCKTENVWAMARAVKKYGKYPLDPNLLKLDSWWGT